MRCLITAIYNYVTWVYLLTMTILANVNRLYNLSLIRMERTWKDGNLETEKLLRTGDCRFNWRINSSCPGSQVEDKFINSSCVWKKDYHCSDKCSAHQFTLSSILTTLRQEFLRFKESFMLSSCQQSNDYLFESSSEITEMIGIL